MNSTDAASGCRRRIEMGAWLALGLLIFAGLVLVLPRDAGTLSGLESSDIAILASGLALLVFLGFPLLGEYRGRLGQAAKDIISWSVLALVLVAGYSFRDEITPILSRVTGELSPPGTALSVEGLEAGQRAVRIRRMGDGQFVARTIVNGVSLRMIVDTGASTVVLTQNDAQRIGFSVTGLRYIVPVQTANGTSYAARVQLRDVNVGDIGLRRVEALIAKPGALHQSLLGMSFLSRLRSYEFSGDFLTLRS